MSGQPAISVVIPTYQRAHCISRAIDSVLAQEYAADIEIIVVDDGSTDGTSDMLRQRYRDAIRGDVMRVIEQSNSGAAAARNAGLDAASGRAIVFLDSDDEWTPVRLQRDEGLRRLVDGSAVMSWCGFTASDGRRSWRSRPVRTRTGVFEQCLSLRHGTSVTSCLAVSGRSVESGLRFDPALEVLEDLDLVLRAAVLGEVLISASTEVRRHVDPNERLYAGASVARGWLAFARKWDSSLLNRPSSRARVWRHVARVHVGKIDLYSSVLPTALAATRGTGGVGRLAARSLGTLDPHRAMRVIGLWSRVERVQLGPALRRWVLVA